MRDVYDDRPSWGSPAIWTLLGPVYIGLVKLVSGGWWWLLERAWVLGEVLRVEDSGTKPGVVGVGSPREDVTDSR